MFFQVEGGPHLFQSYLHEVQDDLPLTTREMHPSFESLAMIGAPSLRVYFMDIHHDTFIKSILEDDSIYSASKACIHSCSGKGVGLWLVVKPFIYSFCITHFTFTLTLLFYFGLI
jgi:hypothetical protein